MASKIQMHCSDRFFFDEWKSSEISFDAKFIIISVKYYYDVG